MHVASQSCEIISSDWQPILKNNLKNFFELLTYPSIDPIYICILLLICHFGCRVRGLSPNIAALSPYLGSGPKGVDAILQLSAHPSRFSLSIAVSPFLLLTATWPSLCNWPQIRQRFNKYLSRAIPYFSFSKLRRQNIASTFHSLSLL